MPSKIDTMMHREGKRGGISDDDWEFSLIGESNFSHQLFHTCFKFTPMCAPEDVWSL